MTRASEDEARWRHQNETMASENDGENECESANENEDEGKSENANESEIEDERVDHETR